VQKKWHKLTRVQSFMRVYVLSVPGMKFCTRILIFLPCAFWNTEYKNIFDRSSPEMSGGCRGATVQSGIGHLRQNSGSKSSKNYTFQVNTCSYVHMYLPTYMYTYVGMYVVWCLFENTMYISASQVNLGNLYKKFLKQCLNFPASPRVGTTCIVLC
jgi:hypothetical protein